MIYRIADFYCSIEFAHTIDGRHYADERMGEVCSDVNDGGGCRNGEFLLPSFDVFKQVSVPADEQLLFTVNVRDDMKVCDDHDVRRIIDADTPNGVIQVDGGRDGFYQFVIKDSQGQVTALVHATRHFKACDVCLYGDERKRSFGLNNALMLIFAFSAAIHDAVLIHASLVRNAGWGYAFTAPSGTGKSTHTALWMQNIPGCDMMNDDNPVIRVINGKSYIYGSPWSGKTPLYRDVKAPLGAVTKIVRDAENRVEPLHPLAAFVMMVEAVSSMKWDATIYDAMCKTLTSVIENTQMYAIHCRPDAEAARVCYDGIRRDK